MSVKPLSLQHRDGRRGGPQSQLFHTSCYFYFHDIRDHRLRGRFCCFDSDGPLHNYQSDSCASRRICCSQCQLGSYCHFRWSTGRNDDNFIRLAVLFTARSIRNGTRRAPFQNLCPGPRKDAGPTKKGKYFNAILITRFSVLFPPTIRSQ